MNPAEQRREDIIKDPIALIAKDLTAQVLGRLEGLVVAELDDAGEAVGKLYQTIYRSVGEVVQASEPKGN